jgi:hypothetical protein
MSTQLEQDLREALSQHAAALPSNVSDGVLARDYRPRGSVGRVALAATTLTLAAAVVFAVSVVGLGSDPPRAFAGWSATPTLATSDQVSKARSRCRSQLARMARSLLISRVEQSRGNEPLSAPPVAVDLWHTVLIDTRGPYTLILFEADHGRATSVCFSGARKQGALGAGIGLRPPAPVPPGQVTYNGSGHSVTGLREGSHEFSWVIGRTGAGVEGVTIRLNNGTRVTASRAKGWFLAWWPGSHGIRATEFATATEKVIRGRGLRPAS